MSYFDDNEDFIIYGQARRSPRQHREPPTCKRCGKTGLTWVHDGDGWVLCEGKFKVHKCDFKSIADDFEVLP